MKFDVIKCALRLMYEDAKQVVPMVAIVVGLLFWLILLSVHPIGTVIASCVIGISCWFYLCYMDAAAQTRDFDRYVEKYGTDGWLNKTDK